MPREERFAAPFGLGILRHFLRGVYGQSRIDSSDPPDFLSWTAIRLPLMQQPHQVPFDRGRKSLHRHLKSHANHQRISMDSRRRSNVLQVGL